MHFIPDRLIVTDSDRSWRGEVLNPRRRDDESASSSDRTPRWPHGLRLVTRKTASAKSQFMFLLFDVPPLNQSHANVCVCVHSCFQGHYSSYFYSYDFTILVQHQQGVPGTMQVWH